MQNKILSLLVDNTSGVLSRIAGMFSRRGYNIDSITAGVTADVNYTRITVVCSGDDAILDQIVKQLAKLVDVRDIKVLDPSDSVVRETVLVKVAAAPEQRQRQTFLESRQYFAVVFVHLCRLVSRLFARLVMTQEMHTSSVFTK